jgi:hypothetical protein
MSSTPSNTGGSTRRTAPRAGCVANSASTSQSSIAVIATICCATMSSGLRGIAVASTAPSCIALATARARDEIAAEFREDDAFADRVR